MDCLKKLYLENLRFKNLYFETVRFQNGMPNGHVVLFTFWRVDHIVIPQCMNYLKWILDVVLFVSLVMTSFLLSSIR